MEETGTKKKQEKTVEPPTQLTHFLHKCTSTERLRNDKIMCDTTCVMDG